MPKVVERLRQLTTAPKSTGEYNNWLRQGEVFEFMRESIEIGEVVLYASMRGVFIHAVFVPGALVDPPDHEDLKNWACNPYDSWSVRYDGSIAPPLSNSRSETLAQGEQVIFGRRFVGEPELSDYIEISQQFIHVLDLHYLRSRSAWCRFDRHGEIEDVVRIVQFEEPHPHFSGIIVVVKRDALSDYLMPQDLRLLRMFEFKLYKESSYPLDWKNIESSDAWEDMNFFARLHIDDGYASFSRGIQVATIEDDEVDLSIEEEQNVAFLAHDVCTNTVRLISRDTMASGNRSPSPIYDLCPAFFRPDVLLKYKQDSEKFTLKERSIACRGGWQLKTYDINEEGQVHTYLIYLWQLPYEEQWHWKEYNERPKASISKRAFETDLLGAVHREDANSLRNLRQFLSQLECKWWKAPRKDLLDRVHYPVTDSTDEWEDELLLLDQLLIEGLNEKWLRAKAKELNVALVHGVRSIGLIEKCLTGMGLDSEDAQSKVAPLRLLHYHRNKLKAHASQASARRELKAEAISCYGSYNRHYTYLAHGCFATFRFLHDVFGTTLKSPSRH